MQRVVMFFSTNDRFVYLCIGKFLYLCILASPVWCNEASRKKKRAREGEEYRDDSRNYFNWNRRCEEMKMKKKRWEWKEVRPAMALIWRESWMTRFALECGTCGWLEEFGSVHPYTSIISNISICSIAPMTRWQCTLHVREDARTILSLTTSAVSPPPNITQMNICNQTKHWWTFITISLHD